MIAREISHSVLAVVGTRPEVIKLAPVIAALRASPDFEVSLCAVAQQTTLLRDALGDWALTPDAEIPIANHEHGVAGILAEMLPALADLLHARRPNLLMVQGDTTTNLGASLAAFYEQVPVIHVEAGLRSGDKAQPFPEEMHRVLTDHLAAIHYAPTERARANLLAEGCAPDSRHRGRQHRRRRATYDSRAPGAVKLTMAHSVPRQ